MINAVDLARETVNWNVYNAKVQFQKTCFSRKCLFLIWFKKSDLNDLFVEPVIYYQTNDTCAKINKNNKRLPLRITASSLLLSELGFHDKGGIFSSRNTYIKLPVSYETERHPSQNHRCNHRDCKAIFRLNLWVKYPSNIPAPKKYRPAL